MTDVTPDSPTTCATSGQRMEWDGARWTHEAGKCTDPGHLPLTDRLDAIQERWKTSICLTRFPVSPEAAAKARGEVMGVDVPFLLDLARKQQAALEAVFALHKPEKRWMPYDGAGVSYDTEREALEATEDVDLNSVVMEDIAENGVPYFEVCAQCKRIEDSPCEGECTLEAGYRESIWPCPTVQALEANL